MAIREAEPELAATAPPSPAIRVVGLGKEFPLRGGAASVLRSISFRVPPGQFLSLIGPSGCGKSTLLQIVAGLQPASAGDVWFRDQRVDRPPKGMIYVFQQYAKSVFPWRTVKANMAFGLEQRRMPRAEMDARIDRLLSLVGLSGSEDLLPRQLSGGMQQRLALARALACEPEVLLMDEPFSAVDALTRLNLQQLLMDLWQRFHTTVIFVTHDVEEAILLSQRVICLSRAPTSIVEDLRVDIPYPRHPVATREHPAFLACRHRLLASVFEGEEAALPGGAAVPGGAPA